ncbi:MAG: glycoside hydrolase family 9 protein [Defluviitaleaceae bacterium]|nr:glycoside hydrolase family 9 protein [Defluviitaleaceae bacterium]
MVKAILLNKDTGYFENGGVNMMAFDDIYPEGHQSGVSIIMHGNRVATNGDVRFEQTPGQWQPVPKQGERILDEEANTITTSLSYPDKDRHLRGFNPMIYPDFEFGYTVTVRGTGESVTVTVDLSAPVPERFLGKLCFNLELFPGALFGKPWMMDDAVGLFPMQPNGKPMPLPPNHPHTGEFALPDARGNLFDLTSGTYNPMTTDDLIATPYATGKIFVSRPDCPYNRLTVESKGADIKLYDGRMNHNNGWFVLSSEIPAGKTKNAVEWVITPNAVQDWKYEPVIQTSQVGYHPLQPKAAIIELDKNEIKREIPTLYKITANGSEKAYATAGEEWGRFLRYDYIRFDFSHIREAGLYQIKYGASESSVFIISEDVYDHGVWQPVLEYFLPVQMCHMRVSEKYRVWHGLCHIDDAQMAPTDYNHIDGYRQGPTTLCDYQPGDFIGGLDAGGWHDAGDFDLRVESQAGEAYILSLIYETFDVNHDATAICQQTKTVEIHQPDGKNDLLQQIEHGALCVINALRAVGRHFRGIIERNLRQYVHLGDSMAMTDGIKENNDDRWLFTEYNPRRELTTAAQLAAVARALNGFNDTLGNEALRFAREIFDAIDPEAIGEESGWNGRNAVTNAKIHAAAELLLSTKDEKYKDYLIKHTDFIAGNIAHNHMGNLGWVIARAEEAINDEDFSAAIRKSLPILSARLTEQSGETPYGIPYRPHIWGAGWGIQRAGFEYYYLHTHYPDIFPPDMVYDSLNFVLGCHPGPDSVSFASGVGAKSAAVGYGLNRADWSYIPGGVVSGTALIRPDLPELLTFPYLWQQVEYVMGGGSSHYMFLVLAVIKMLKGKDG